MKKGNRKMDTKRENIFFTRDVFVFNGQEDIKAFSMGDTLILNDIKYPDAGDVTLDRGFYVPAEITNAAEEFKKVKMDMVHLPLGAYLRLSDTELDKVQELYEEHRAQSELDFANAVMVTLNKMPPKHECGCKDRQRGTDRLTITWLDGALSGVVVAFLIIFIMVVTGKRK